MKDYTFDVKVRFHVSIPEDSIDETIGDIINYMAEELSNDYSLEIQALSYEEGSWFLFEVNDETDRYVKRWLANKIG